MLRCNVPEVVQAVERGELTLPAGEVLAGLGMELATIERMVVDSPETSALLAKACGPEKAHGGDRKSEAFQGDNSTLKRGSTSAAYLSRRLLRDAPDVFERMGLTAASNQASM